MHSNKMQTTKASTHKKDIDFKILRVCNDCEANCARIAICGGEIRALSLNGDYSVSRCRHVRSERRMKSR